MSKKQEIQDINLIEIGIQLHTLALDAHPIDLKSGRQVAKRIVKLAYIQDGGIIKAPVHLWLFGWLKSVFKSKAANTVVYLPDKLPAFSLGTAKDLLVGKSAAEWEQTGDKNVVYELGDELVPYNLYPYHEFVSQKGGKGSIIKYYYTINAKSKPVRLFVYSMIPPKLIVDNMKNLGKVYGLGSKAHGYRIGTFDVISSNVSKIGEVSL